MISAVTLSLVFFSIVWLYSFRLHTAKSLTLFSG